MNQDRTSTITNSQLKEGYKQTEVGIIPEDWEVGIATQVCEIIIDCKNRTPPVIEGGEFAVVRTPNVRNGRFVYEDLRFTDESSFREWTARAVPQIGDILITREAPLGEVCLVPKELKVCLGQRMMLYRPDKSKIDSAFFLYSLMAPIVQKCLLEKIGGSTVGHAKVDDIRNISIPLPPTKTEQEAIACTLSDIDALIESLDRLLTKKCQIKQGAMQELLSPYENGSLKNSWTIKKLGELAFITKLAGFEYSNYFNSYNDGGEIIIIRGTNITKNKLDLSDVKNIPVSTSNKLIRSKLFKNDLVFAYVGTIGPIWMVDEDDRYHLGPNTCKIRAEEKVLAEYLRMYFTSELIEKEIINSVSTGAQPSLSMTKIRGFQIYYPIKIEEQIEIANILSDMDAEIESISTKLTKTRQLKQGMMHELLTGRIRLLG